MGMFGKRYRSKIADNTPNPKNFNIEKVKQIGNNFVSLIHYPNSTNFEGKKILLTTFNPSHRKELDPHFRPYSGIIARFEPTETGWQLACRTADVL